MTDTSIPTTVAPQVLLINHFKTLKLPTFAREYEKVGIECARDGVDYPRYLLRLCELECIAIYNVLSCSQCVLQGNAESRVPTASD